MYKYYILKDKKMITQNTKFNNIKLGGLQKITGIGTNYIIVEVEKTQSRQNTYPSNIVVLNEIEFYDSGSNVIPYTTTEVDAYDSVNFNIPHYWNNGSWGRYNLNDMSTTYDPSTSTGFLYNAENSVGSGVGWARFLLQFDSTVDISAMSFWTSSNSNRDIHIVRVYKPQTLSTVYNKTQMIDNRDNTNLELSWEVVNDLSTTGDGVIFSTNF